MTGPLVVGLLSQEPERGQGGVPTSDPDLQRSGAGALGGLRGYTDGPGPQGVQPVQPAPRRGSRGDRPSGAPPRRAPAPPETPRRTSRCGGGRLPTADVVAAAAAAEPHAVPDPCHGCRGPDRGLRAGRGRGRGRSLGSGPRRRRTRTEGRAAPGRGRRRRRDGQRRWWVEGGAGRERESEGPVEEGQARCARQGSGDALTRRPPGELAGPTGVGPGSVGARRNESGSGEPPSSRSFPPPPLFSPYVRTESSPLSRSHPEGRVASA